LGVEHTGRVVLQVVHASDWDHANATAAFIKSASQEEQPFMAYVGFDIVHPGRA